MGYSFFFFWCSGGHVAWKAVFTRVLRTQENFVDKERAQTALISSNKMLFLSCLCWVRERLPSAPHGLSWSKRVLGSTAFSHLMEWSELLNHQIFVAQRYKVLVTVPVSHWILAQRRISVFTPFVSCVTFFYRSTERKRRTRGSSTCIAGNAKSGTASAEPLFFSFVADRPDYPRGHKKVQAWCLIADEPETISRFKRGLLCTSNRPFITCTANAT